MQPGTGARIGKAHVAELDGSAAELQVGSIGRVEHGLRPRHHPERLVDEPELLPPIHQREREVAGAVQDPERQSGDDHDIARRDPTLPPEKNGPGEHRARGKA